MSGKHDRTSSGSADASPPLVLGDATVRRVVEWVGPVAPAQALFPDTPPRAWQELDEAEGAHHWRQDGGEWRGAMQTWVVRTPEHLVIVDTGVGNDRDRPQAPRMAGWSTPFLERLAAAGVRPSDVDVVINTHIHYDHVGWNTHLVEGRWVPTFPRARYLVPADDYEYFDPANAHRMRPAKTEDERRRFEASRLVFEDSIAPLAAAHELELWRGSMQLADDLRLEQVGGHTPGSSVVWLDSGAGAVFVGDLLHTPLQISRPTDRVVFDLDETAASVARRRILERAAAEDRWVFPAHLAGPGGFRIAERGSAFEITEWAPFLPV